MTHSILLTILTLCCIAAETARAVEEKQRAQDEGILRLTASPCYRPKNGEFCRRLPIEAWRQRTKKSIAPEITYRIARRFPSYVSSSMREDEHKRKDEQLAARLMFQHYLPVEGQHDWVSEEAYFHEVTPLVTMVLLKTQHTLIRESFHPAGLTQGSLQYEYTHPLVGTVINLRGYGVVYHGSSYSLPIKQNHLPLGLYDPLTVASYNTQERSLYHYDVRGGAPILQYKNLDLPYSRYTHMAPILTDDGHIAGRFLLIALLGPSSNASTPLTCASAVDGSKIPKQDCGYKQKFLQGHYLLIHPSYQYPISITLPDVLQSSSSSAIIATGDPSTTIVGTRILCAYNYHQTLVMDYDWFSIDAHEAQSVAISPIRRAQVNLLQQ